MKQRAYGFTIVELIIVIVVIAILASISIVTYRGITDRANNTSRIAAGEQWVRAFQLYQVYNGAMPPSVVAAADNTRFCLGSGFPMGGGGVARCQNVTGTDGNSAAESNNATLMSELQAATDLPRATPIPTKPGFTGPYLVRGATSIQVTIGLDGYWAIGTDCGGGFISNWNNNTNTITACIKTLSL
ncbi:MAG TPA: prepilin-type N-terminal cleavage/methylation domain-containing protein [Candidatus Saccharibacteria bacterium]|nr:prepilin-type N-terminal cleavage/methylation domain-containing protein [Candidatus Saccharibacteria bacterium]HMR38251.1 prepilin-type N-terminal cleavage/methylation domain-containing protein [Candidatus Saccharibacteria bacterium]